MKEIKASQNKVEAVETKPVETIKLQPPRQSLPIDGMDSERLALLLNGEYGRLMQAQANINIINRVLEFRQKENTNGNERSDKGVS